MNKQPRYKIGEEVKLRITLEVTATVAGHEPDADENTYLYELKEFGYSLPSNSDVYFADGAEDFDLFDEPASIFREHELSVEGVPLFQAGEQVKYWGGNMDHWGKVYTIEDGIQHRPEYHPQGFYYDLDHCELKQVHESTLNKA